ncbi:MAG: hypothetical protein DDT34_01379 [Firmicutes bacterium]|nr:hypothetical protein [Bacillota bacterium]
MVAQADIRGLQANRQQPLMTKRTPVGEPLQICARTAEKFEFHLLKLARAEDKIARGDFVAKGLADLSYAKRQFASRGTRNIAEVYKNSLGSLGAQVDLGARIISNPLIGLKHKVELPYVRKIMRTALRAFYARGDYIGP